LLLWYYMQVIASVGDGTFTALCFAVQ